MSQLSRSAIVQCGGILVMLWILAGVAMGAAAPVVLECSPSDGEQITLDASVVIVFDQAMDRDSVQDAWRLEPEIDGAFEWSDDQTVRFLPEALWERATSYTLTLLETARSVSGEALRQPHVLHFRSAGYIEVAQISPDSDAVDVAVDSAFFVMFNRPIVPLLTLSDPATADLPQPLVLDPAVPGAGEWINTSVYVFTPSVALQGGTIYTATVPAGLTDTVGAILPEDVSWQFSTDRPEVIGVSPHSDEDLVPIDTSVRITFNMAVSLETVETRFSLKESGLFGDWLSDRVAGTWTADGNTAIFTPDEPLAFDQKYVISLEEGVTGRVGGLGTTASLRTRFETVPLPRILYTNPQDGDKGVYSYTSFVIGFNTPIDPDTVLDNITIVPAQAPGVVSGYFRSWDNSYVVTFDSGPSQSYEVNIGPNIADRYGNHTGQELTVRFQTRALDPTVWLHVPGQIGTFSTYQQARVFVGHRNTETLHMTLTRLTIADYFEAIDDWYRYSPPNTGRVRTWSVPVSGPLNEVAYAPVDLLPDGEALPAGIYMIDLEADGVSWNRWQHRHILIASPVNLTMKTSDNATLVWACDLSTGAPVPGLILRSYDDEGNAVDATVTDINGLATFDGTDGYGWRGITVASTLPFTLSSAQWTSGISVWDFGYSMESSPEERLFLDTDRPIYRPGQTVSFRGVVRDEQDALYAQPTVGSVAVLVRDPDWTIVYQGSLDLDAFGTFAGQLDLPDDAAVGTYRVEMSTETSYYSESFDVAAYRAPEFEVVVTPEYDELVAGDTVRILIQTDYFFGAPVVDQAVDWDIYAESYAFSPPALGRYTFTDRDDPWRCWSCWWLPAEAPTPILDGSAVTDSSGLILIEIPAEELLAAEEDTTTGSRRLTVEATALGADGQVISGRGSIVIHAADVYAGLAAARSVGRAGDPTTLDIVTVDWDGERMPLQTLSYRVVRREWENVFEEDDAGGGQWTWTVHDIEIETGGLAMDENGSGTLSFTPPDGGTYKVVVSGRDAAGHETRSSLFLWASGPETVSWRRSNDDRITLVPDRTEYHVGDVARILIPSPYAEPHYALVTIERSGVLFRDVLRLESNSTVLEIPITEAHVPNVYVSVVLFQGLEDARRAAEGSHVAETKVGYAALTVSRELKTLHIEMTPSDAAPLPATDITYDLWITDAYGDPVQTAIAFDLVDAAVLSLRPRTSNAIVEAFYARRGLGISTSSGLTVSVNRLVAEQMDEFEGITEERNEMDDLAGVAFAPAAMAEDVGAATGEMVRSSAVAQLPEGITLREDFQDTAFWDGSILTDEDGHAQITFRLPDNLTTWVARAVGVTLDTELGESTQDLLVTKPLLIRPVTPRFFVVGDRARLLANVSNQTDVDVIADVTLAYTGLSLEDPAIQTVTIPAHGESAVTWWATVQDVDLVDVAFSVVAGDQSDAARPRLTTGPDGTLLVYKYASPEIVGTAGQLEEADSRTEVVAVPSSIDVSRTELTLRLETSLAAAMQEGLDYLEHFEYECTEQVVSRFLPNVLTVRALRDLGISRPDLEEKLPGLVAEGLEKLYAQQNTDGGWGWWDGMESNAYLTAYAVYGLLQAERAGFVVIDNVLEDGLDYLTRQLVPVRRLTSFSAADRQAWIAYVLSEGSRYEDALDVAEDLFAHRSKLSHYARAWLALTLQLSGGETDAIETLQSDLYSEAILSATGVHWEEANYDWWAMNTDTRSTAIILDALVRLDPNQPLLPNVVRWLMVARSGGIWETTQETAWALISLTDWMVATGELAASYEFGASLNGQEVLEGLTDGSPLDVPIELRFGAESLLLGQGNEVTVSRSEGPGRLYYTAHLTSYLLVDEITDLERGIIVQREYVPVSSPAEQASEGVESVVVGKEILVRLTLIAPHDLYYVVVEDPFPAGCEPVDPSLATTSLTAAEPSLIRDTDDPWGWWFSWWWWQWYSRSEFRDEKVVLFADYLPSGTYTFQYTLRAVVPGEFGVLPTLAQEFYFPEVFGRSSGRSLSIEPAEN